MTGYFNSLNKIFGRIDACIELLIYRVIPICRLFFNYILKFITITQICRWCMLPVENSTI